MCCFPRQKPVQCLNILGGLCNFVENKHLEVPIEHSFGHMALVLCLFVPGIGVSKDKFMYNFARVLQEGITRFLSTAFLPSNMCKCLCLLLLMTQRNATQTVLRKALPAPFPLHLTPNPSIYHI